MNMLNKDLNTADTDWSGRVGGVLPKHRDLFYDGAWHKPSGGYSDLINPATGASLGQAAVANAEDVDRAAQAANRAFKQWRRTTPLHRAEHLRKLAAVLREHAEELALLDAANCGNPLKAMIPDVHSAARRIDLFAGLGTEIKGTTIPAGADVLSMTLREPYGACARLVAYNHPILFFAGKMAAPLATGNTVIMKPSQQAPLSAYRLMELIADIFPPGVVNMVTGGMECGEALTVHPDLPAITLVGSVAVGRAIARAAGDRLKHVALELGGKNALIVYPDADLDKAIAGAAKGMNFTWCGQSCGSTSRLFLHEDIYDRVLDGVIKAASEYKPGIPTDLSTNMGAIVSKAQQQKIMGYIEAGQREGAKLVLGGGPPSDPLLANGFFIEPTIFADVTMQMSIAREEIFGPVMSVLKWRDEEQMLAEVNGVDYGLTGAIYTSNLSTAHRVAAEMEAGLITINETTLRAFGGPFGGYKMSGIGRESSIEEMFAFTQIKNVITAL